MPVLRTTILIVATACATQLVAARFAFAQSMTVSANAAVTINAAHPNGGLEPAIDNSTTYTLTTTAANQRLLAKLNCSLPSGVTLSLQVTGATSNGTVTLIAATDVEVLGPIAIAGTTGGSIIYTLNATLAAGTLATVPCSVIFSVP